MGRRVRWAALLAAIVFTDLVAIPVLAQTATLEEVVVTARKRDETLQNVPVTVDVFTAQTIQDARINTPADVVRLVPNMNLVETQNVGNAFVVIRGISQARNSEPSVAVLVDGVLETNPAEFNQELVDVTHIEVLKGPQGALYGRNAIGGAIIIRTAEPSDQFEGRALVGAGNGSEKRAQVMVGGPFGSGSTLKYRASLNYYDDDGYIDNVFLNQKADPYKNYTARLRLLWKPSDFFTGDLRLHYDRVETKALYFVIPRADEANPFSTFTTPPDANNVTTPITLDNPGENNRDLYDAALKMDFNTAYGTVTSISAWNETKEILTGDAFDFRPAPVSIFEALFGTDLNQSQYLNVKAYSQELRFTSPAGRPFTWIAGAYYVHTDRFISTGNMVDTGAGVFPVYYDPRLTGPNPNFSFLADTQNNNAWAVFGDATYEFTPQWEFDAAIRYDEDKRKNTTDTPQAFLPQPLPPPAPPTVHTGDVREHTWSEPQPKATLRYKPSDALTFYGGWSRGFRSGGFNQTGVGTVALANGILGVNDLFNAEVADTWEVGMKGVFLDRKLNVSAALFHTKSTNGYFFVFLAANSTQNLGNLDATYKGGELEITAKPTDRLDLYASVGYTDSEITNMADPAVKGNQAPLVARTTFNAGVQYKQPFQNELRGVVRLDFRNIGRMWWEPYNVTSRDPISLLNARLGVETDKWSLMAWSENLTDKKYNTEFSPSPGGAALPISQFSTAYAGPGFLFKARPRTYGLDFTYRF
jgi:iron complex outermembrane receptor protein